MRSFRGRFILIAAAVAVVAVGLTTWAIAARTQDSVIDRLAQRDQEELEITETLTVLALGIEQWSMATDEVEELAERFDARIALTDGEGRLLIDTEPGSALPELVAIIDPLGPFAEFGGEFSELDFNLAAAECLDREGVAYEFDEFDNLFLIDEFGGEEADECFEEAFEKLGSIPVEGIAEPAWLFVDFADVPSIPWPQLAVVAAVVIALAALAATFSATFVAGPIQRLTEATRAIRRGDFDARVDVTTPDEIRELAGSFNEMAAELQREDSRRKRLTSDIAHELRSPVTNIVGHLDAIEDGLLEPTPEQLGVVSSEAGRLHRLIEDLRQLAVVEEGGSRLDLFPQDVGALVQRVADAHQTTTAQSGVAITCDCEEQVATVDGPRIEQIVGNLVMNAIDALDGGGSIELRVTGTKDDVAVAVSDDGPGIPAELLPVIFDRFRRHDEARTPGNGGRGLGLAISRALARAHGGDLTAHNNDTGGATFTLTLPR